VTGLISWMLGRKVTLRCAETTSLLRWKPSSF